MRGGLLQTKLIVYGVVDPSGETPVVTNVDLALRKTAWQSTTPPDRPSNTYSASNANDGDPTTRSSTYDQYDESGVINWWAVDLGNIVAVTGGYMKIHAGNESK